MQGDTHEHAMPVEGYRRNPLERLYWTARWKRIRRDQLAREPYCAMCKPILTLATVCDHVTPHRGDETLFWSGPFASLCARHHNSDKQSAEKLGFTKAVDASGMPVDPSHPWNR